MPYTPNNPLIPGDPYSYDLKWIVKKLKYMDKSIAGIIDGTAIKDAAFYNSVSDMIAAESIQDGNIIITLGYNSPDDLGSQLYVVSAIPGNMAITLNNGLYANPVILNDSINVAQYGIFPGQECSSTLQDLIDYAEANEVHYIHFNEGVYIKHDAAITIDMDDIHIIGAGTVIDNGYSSGFGIESGRHDISFKNIKSICAYSGVSNYHYGVKYDYTDPEDFYCYNLIFEDLDCSGGVFGISATAAKNIKVNNCSFDNFTFVPGDSAGGYAILTQACKNILIKECIFNMGALGRHDIYISVVPGGVYNPSYNISKDICIQNCSFEHKDLGNDPDNYYSPRTSPVVVRTAENIIFTDNCIRNSVGAISFNLEDGNISGAIISHIIVDTPVVSTSAAEQKSIIAVVASAGNEIELSCSDVNVINDGTYPRFINIVSGKYKITGCSTGQCDFYVTNGATLQISDISCNITSKYMFRFDNTDTAYGMIRNISNAANVQVLVNFSTGSLVAASMLPPEWMQFVAAFSPTAIEQAGALPVDGVWTGNDLKVTFPNLTGGGSILVLYRRNIAGPYTITGDIAGGYTIKFYNSAGTQVKTEGFRGMLIPVF